MANAERENAATPLMSDNDLERSSVHDSFEYVVYENSESDSATLSGSTVNEQLSPVYDDKRGFKDDEEVMSDTEALPENVPMDSQHEKEALLAKDDHKDENTSKGQVDQDEGNHRCIRRRFFGRCGARASMKCDKKRRVRRRIVLFIKATLLLGFFSFFIARMCMRHKKDGRLSGFRGDSPQGFFEDAQTSREIVIKHGSHDINGQYPLYDLLALETTSGNINVVVDPQPAHPAHPDEPARLILKSLSGSISVAFIQQTIDVSDDDDDIPGAATSVSQTKSQIPYRPYEVEIHTHSGSINGNIIFTSSAHLETHSGPISVSLTPVISLDGDAIDTTQIVTKTHSAVQSISVTEPLIIKGCSDASYYGEGDPTSTTSFHTSKSGSIHVEYPHSWAGNVTALSSSGPVVVGGDSLEITESHRGYVKGVKYPDDDQQVEWWGSRGDSDVVLEATGPILFHVRD